MSTEPTSESKPQAPLITRSSILILAGLLIGVTWTTAFHDGLSSARFYAFSAALAGVLAFLVLDLVAEQRRVRASRMAHQRAIERLEQRVDRHLLEEV